MSKLVTEEERLQGVVQTQSRGLKSERLPVKVP